MPPKTLPDVMLEAKKRLLISGHTLDHFARREDIEVNGALDTLLSRGVEVTLILLHPSSPYAEAHDRFHKDETEGPQKSSIEQIKNTIKYFENNLAFLTQHEHLTVYLSDYMPRFRTIIIDDSKCYVNLYMYGKDVDVTPKHEYPSGTQEFKTIRGSVNTLLESIAVTPLVKNGKFNFSWDNHAISYALSDCLDKKKCPFKCPRWQQIQSVLLANQGSRTDMTPNLAVCDSTYRAGTFTLAELKEKSAQYLKLSKSLTFKEWLEKAVKDEWKRLAVQPQIQRHLEKYTLLDLYNKVRGTLLFKPHGYKPLVEKIWYQEYSDIIQRIILVFIDCDPNADLNLDSYLTEDSLDTILNVIQQLESEQTFLKDWLEYSVIAGLLGVDKKSDYSATSVVYQKRGISLDREKGPTNRAIDIIKQLKEIKNLPREVDDSGMFFEMLEYLENTLGDVNLVSFTDDYLETLFLLKFYNELLKSNLSVNITIIPRSIHCGNDATASDLEEFLSYSVFNVLNKQRDKKFKICRDGPEIGGVNLVKLHPEVIDIIKDAHLLDVRGARNYEMMQRIKKDTFFGFTVARTTSEVVTALKWNEKPFFYKFQEAGTCTFKV
jgi:hypothetical protein